MANQPIAHTKLMQVPATNSTITLSYRNTGLSDASNFAINSAPTGYTIDNSSTCGSSITTLQASGANSCTVVIKPTISTAGALNVNLSSSLSGSWTDEHGSVNNQTILWNTGSGTQNTIYVNIFATPQVAAAMSSSSSGNPCDYSSKYRTNLLYCTYSNWRI